MSVLIYLAIGLVLACLCVHPQGERIITLPGWTLTMALIWPLVVVYWIILAFNYGVVLKVKGKEHRFERRNK